MTHTNGVACNGSDVGHVNRATRVRNVSLVIQVRMPEELVDRVDARAEAEYRSRSSMVAYLVAKGLEKLEQKEEDK